MTPKFARYVDPIFECTLGLLDRIDLGENPKADRIQQHYLTKLFADADQNLGDDPHWKLAKKALVYWIDEVLAGTQSWQGSDWWKNNLLEWRLYSTREGAMKFFVDTQQAAGNQALEVFYLCVILGFRGVYDDPKKSRLAIAQYQLPSTLDDWLRENAQAMRPSPSQAITPTGHLPDGAPPLEGYSFFMSTLLVSAVLLAISTGIILVQFF